MRRLPQHSTSFQTFFTPGVKPESFQDIERLINVTARGVQTERPGLPALASLALPSKCDCVFVK